jgi:hypothetical protein
MRRLAIFASILLVALVGVAVRGPLADVDAQDGTPFPLWPPVAPGITAWEVGQFSQWPATYRLEFEPGSIRPGYDNDPALYLVYVETGVLTVEATAPIAVTRAGAGGTPELVAAGTAFTVGPGDFFVVPPEVAAETRNEGQEVAAAQYAAILPPFDIAAATPVAAAPFAAATAPE